jgi:hypothetical protein
MLTAKFHELFHVFVEEFQKAGYPSQYLERGPKEVSDAYQAFINYLAHEVKDDTAQAETE